MSDKTTKTWQGMKDGLTEGLSEVFPIIGKKQELHLSDISIKDNLDPADSASQKKAILNGSSWTVPVHGTLTLKDKSGKPLDSTKIRLLSLPKTTDRGTIIYNGTEYNITNQLRLKPGVYTSIGADEITSSHFNVDKGANFELWQDPVKGNFFMKFQQSSLPIYPILKELGVADSEMVRYWGKEIFDSNKNVTPARYKNSILSAYKKLTYNKEDVSYDEAAKQLKDVLAKSTIDDGAKVSASALLEASRRILRINKKEDTPDDRESLEHKAVYGPEDFLKETIVKGSRPTVWKIKSRMDGLVPRKTVKDIVLPGTFSTPVYSNLNSSSLVSVAGDANPLSLLEATNRITSFGPGGITSTHAIPESLRNIHPSHIGFLDSVRTPESDKAGIDLQLGMNARKEGNTLQAALIDKNGRKIYKSPAELKGKIIAFPKQPAKGKVEAVMDGKLITTTRNKVDYAIPGVHDMFSYTTNLVPFLSNNAGARANLGGKMSTQALSLKYREAPLVQSDSGVSGQSMERVVGDSLLPHSPVDGEVVSVDRDKIKVKDKSGNVTDIALYDNYIIGGKNFIDSSPTVQKGENVKKGQLLADTNYTKDGTLALGLNLNTAYVPFRGLTHEDGIVVSESAAKKMVSQHMYRFDLQITEGVELNRNKYQAYFGGKVGPQQFEKLDDSGIVKPDTVVEAGDYIIAAMRESVSSPEDAILGRLHKKLAKPYKDISILWEKDNPGRVVDVVSTTRHITVTVRTDAPLVIGDKITNRAGGKGVVTAVLPDSEMPYNQDKERYEVILNPATVISRMNIGQLTETAASKIASPDKPYIAPSFPEQGENVSRQVQDELKKHNKKEVDTVYDASGVKIGDIFAGKQYFYKLGKTTDTNFSARAFQGGYDADMQPARGGESGAKSIGLLDTYALLSHNARNILRESATSKSEYNPEMWQAIQLGKPLPPPQPTFAFNKFINFLKASGVNVEKEGDRFKLLPLTDKDITGMSSGKILNPLMLKAKDMAEEQGGLFDVNKTGGKSGIKWSHIELSEPVLNPVFTDPARRLLGLKKKEILDMQYQQGGNAIKEKLSEIDVDKRLSELTAGFERLRGTNKDDAIKQIKYLTVLKDAGLRPEDAYIISKVPVIPPVFRPIYQIEGSGATRVSDVNNLYKQVMLVDKGLRDPVLQGLETKEKQPLRRDLFQTVKALQGLDKSDTGKDLKGFIMAIKGDVPKEGFFQSKVLSKKQDIAGRATIGVDPELGLDEIKMPDKMAWILYGPFVIREMVKLGMSVMDAKQEVDDQTDKAKNILLMVMRERPVLLNRAPTLHKFNIMAFKSTPYPGKTLLIPPMIMKPYNADNDGDSVLNSVYTRWLAKGLHGKLDDNYLDGSESSGYNQDDNSSGNYNKGGCDMPFNSNTLVRYQYGVINLKDFPHGELIKSEGNKEVYKVPGDVQVLTVKDGHREWLPVESYSIHKGLSMVEVVTNTSRTIQCSLDNSLVTVDSNLDYQKCEPKAGITMPRLRKVVADDEIEVIRDIALPSDTGARLGKAQQYAFPDILRLDYGLGYFHGAYIGDGWTNNGELERYAICFVTAHTEIADRLKAFVQGYNTGEKPVHFSRVENPHEFDGFKAHSTKYTWYSDRWAKYLKQHMHHGAINKNLPAFWMHAPEEFRWGLLAGLIDTDGSVSINTSKKRTAPQTSAKYDTISQGLAYEIVALAHTLDLTASVLIAKRKTSAGNIAYTVQFTQEAIEVMQGKLLLSNPQKKERLAGFVPGRDYKRNKYTPPLTTARLVELSKSLGTARMALKGPFKQSILQDPDNSKTKTEIEKEFRQLPEVKKIWSLRTMVSISKIGSPDLKKTKGIKGPTPLSRPTAVDIINLDMSIFRDDPFWVKWKAMVLDESIEWEMITDINPLPFITEAYDLTIPPAYTMVTESGIIVYDTMQVHVPVAEEARLEAMNKMMPSQNLFSILDKSPHYAPSNESVFGLYQGTAAADKATGAKAKQYASEADVKKELNNGSLKPNTAIMFNNERTTAGSVAVNSVLPKDLRDYQRVITKKTLSEILRTVGEKYPHEYAGIAKELKDYGDKWAYSTGSSFSFKDFEVPTAIRDDIFARAERKLSRAGSKASIVDVYSDAQSELIDGMMREGKKTGNTFYEWVASGSRGNPVQFTSIWGAPTMVEDLQNRKIAKPIKRNFIEGLSPSEYFTSLYGTRKGITATKLSVTAPGALAKELVASNIDLVVTTSDCGTRKGLVFPLYARDALDRLLAVDIKGADGGRIAARNDRIDSRMFDVLKANNIPSVIARSVMTCETPKGICASCAGVQEDGNLPSIGENLGVKHSMSISEPLTQIALSTKHTAGIKGSDYGIKGFKSMLEMPSSPNVREVLAQTDGSISGVKSLPAGGHVVKIKNDGQETEHLIPAMRTLLKTKGMVSKGDALTDGIPNIADFVSLKGMDAGRRKLSDTISDFYRNSGKSIDSHIPETIARGVLNYARVIDPGDYDVVQGDTIEYNQAAAMQSRSPVSLPVSQTLGYRASNPYKKLKQGTIIDNSVMKYLHNNGFKKFDVYKEPLSMEPIAVGINKIPMIKNDWMSRMGFQHIAKTVTEGAATGATSNIHSLNPIPALSYGAEFGQGVDIDVY